MARKTMKAPTLAGVNAFEELSSPDRSLKNTLTLPAAQAAFFARIGLDVNRAKLVAELAWGAR